MFPGAVYVGFECMPATLAGAPSQNLPRRLNRRFVCWESAGVRAAVGRADLTWCSRSASPGFDRRPPAAGATVDPCHGLHAERSTMPGSGHSSPNLTGPAAGLLGE